MTTKQRNLFFKHLWPAACRAQGWDGSDEERRAMIREATQGAANGFTGCTQNQITAVFNYAKLLANPENVEAARAVANPEEAAREDERGRMVYAIRELGFTDVYVQRIAEWDCRECSVSHWDRLPVEQYGMTGDPGLRRVLIHLTTRRNEKKRQTVPRAQINRLARQLERRTAEAMRTPQ